MKKYLWGLALILLLFLTTGCKKSIVGKWKSIDTDNDFYYTFNKDNTCSYEMTVARLSCTYEDDGEKLTILYKGNDKPTTFEYHFKGIALIIKNTSGKENKFVREN